MAALLAVLTVAVVLALTVRRLIPPLLKLLGFVEANSEIIGTFADIAGLLTFVIGVVGGAIWMLKYLGFVRSGAADGERSMPPAVSVPQDTLAEPDVVESGMIAQQYRDWLIERTADFYVPGPGVRLPIEAWAQLDARIGGGKSGPVSAQELEEWIASYDEWGRLAAPRDHTHKDGTFEADLIEMAGDRVVVVSGPGSGKSTLVAKLAHGYSRTDKIAVRVSLAGIANRIRDGATFKDALLELAVGNSGVSRARAETVLDQPDFLLADGLDECDPDRWVVASQLHDWALARPSTRVIVTTRPVGHDPSLLPGWRHVDLLPLDEEGSRAHGTNVMEAAFSGDRERAEDAVGGLWQELEGNPTAKKAARNPLLLGFLVQLSADGVPLARRRAQLYEQIVRLMRERLGRSEHLVERAPSAFVADRTLELAGWLLQLEPVLSESELLEKIGETLAPDLERPPLAAKQTAEECLDFWQERGVLDHVTAGTRDAIVFVHPTLREYAAGRYASGLGDEDLGGWIAEVRRDALWREPLLLAAGAGAGHEVIETLLDLYDPEDAVGGELALAAQALVEMPAPPTDLTRRVAELVAERLDSDIPTVVFDAAEAVLGMARGAPEILAPAIEPLTRHGRFATRVAAVRVLLECGLEHSDPDVVRGIIEELMEPNEGERELPQRRNSFFVWRFQDRIAYLGIKQLLEGRPDTETDQFVEGVISSGGLISAGTHMELVQYLLDRGYEEMVKRIKGERTSYLPKKFVSAEAMREANQEEIEADRGFLKIVLEAVGGDGAAAPETLDPSEARAVAALVRGLELGEFPVGDWELMVYDNDTEAVRTVLKGGTAIGGIETEQLVREATSLIEYLKGVDPARQMYIPLIGTLTRVPVDPDWHKAADAELAAEDLVRALRHPSEAVAINAAQLIAHGGGAPEAKSLIMGALEAAPEHTYRAVAFLANHLWDEREALENLLAALRDGITVENYRLLLALANLPTAKDDARAAEALLKGLQSENPEVATTLADTMNKAEDSTFPLFEVVTPRLEEVLEQWTERGTTYETHGGNIHGDRCSECNTVPRSPRAALVRQLGQANLLELGYLIELCTDPRDDVRRAAASLAAAKAAAEHAIPDLLTRVNSGKLPLLVLQEVVALPAQALRPAKDHLVDLLSSTSPQIREVIMGALIRGDWIETAQAEALARNALNDEDLGVRDRAVETLRVLEVRHD